MGDILIIGYNAEMSQFVADQLAGFNQGRRRNGRLFFQDGTRLIPARWGGTYPYFENLFLEGLRFSQVFIADDSRMRIMDKVGRYIRVLYYLMKYSDIPVEYQVSILNIDTWNSRFVYETDFY